jgi:hypothetical protein
MNNNKIVSEFEKNCRKIYEKYKKGNLRKNQMSRKLDWLEKEIRHCEEIAFYEISKLNLSYPEISKLKMEIFKREYELETEYFGII